MSLGWTLTQYYDFDCPGYVPHQPGICLGNNPVECKVCGERLWLSSHKDGGRWYVARMIHTIEEEPW